MATLRISRRAVLVGAGLAATGLGIARWKLRQPQALFLSAHHDYSDRPHLGAFDQQGRLLFRLPIELRAHSAAFNPARRDVAVVFARRPGNRLYEIDLASGTTRRVARSSEHRHFYGHGVFSPDGRYLFTTENDFENGVGVIAVRDGETLTQVRQMPSHGVGPHELAFLGDGRTLVVANGGIRTHPDYPRQKLNIHAMEPSLAYVDAASGALRARHALDNRFLSIRHLVVGPGDLVCIALQHEGLPDEATPLVGFQRGKEPIVLAAAPEPVLRSLDHYTASICLHAGSGIAAVSCPRGGQVTFWDTAATRFVTALPIRDAGGICLSADGEGFVVTNGRGDIHTIRADTLQPAAAPVTVAGTRWDNHLTLVPPA